MKKTLCVLALVLALSLVFSSLAFAEADAEAVDVDATEEVVEEVPAPVVTGTQLTDAFIAWDNVVTLTFSAAVDGELTADDFKITNKTTGDELVISKIVYPAGGKKAVITVRKIFIAGDEYDVSYNGGAAVMTHRPK